MSNCSGSGRFGNQFIRCVAFSLIAEKHDLCVTYQNHKEIEQLGVKLYTGTKQFDKNVTLVDTNFMDILDKESIDFNVITNPRAYFQTKLISDKIFEHLTSNDVMNNIVTNNIHKDRYTNNNDCFVHIRLGDVEKYNPGVKYYDDILAGLSCDNIFVSSDTENHSIIKILREKYPNLKIYRSSIEDTIAFASTCKHVILSYGTFSATIGYLSFHSQVYCVRFCKKYAWDWSSRARNEDDMFQGKSSKIAEWKVCG